MDDTTIEREILIDAPVDVVWRTITEPDQIAQWFADHVELDLRPGGTGTFGFDAHATSHPVSAPLHIVAVEPPHRFAFRWSHPDGETPGPGNSLLVELTLTVEGPATTRLRVAETGLDLLAWTTDDKRRYIDEHRRGRARHLGRLAELLTARRA